VLCSFILNILSSKDNVLSNPIFFTFHARLTYKLLEALLVRFTHISSIFQAKTDFLHFALILSQILKLILRKKLLIFVLSIYVQFFSIFQIWLIFYIQPNIKFIQISWILFQS
jgi:hypothetical protein